MSLSVQNPSPKSKQIQVIQPGRQSKIKKQDDLSFDYEEAFASNKINLRTESIYFFLYRFKMNALPCILQKLSNESGTGHCYFSSPPNWFRNNVCLPWHAMLPHVKKRSFSPLWPSKMPIFSKYVINQGFKVIVPILFLFLPSFFKGIAFSLF